MADEQTSLPDQSASDGAEHDASQDADDNATSAENAAAEQLEQWRRVASRTHATGVREILATRSNRLTLLRVFSAAPYLSELCLTHPDVVIDTLAEGPSKAIASSARDLTALNRGSGAADALYRALRPIKHRCDLAIGLAEVSGEWSGADAAAARTDFAERLVEVALQWLARGAYRRGEAQKNTPTDETLSGVFILAGGPFAFEEIGCVGPLDILVLFDGAALREAGVFAPDRTFVRIGTEMKHALEGPPGGRPLFITRAPQVPGRASTPLLTSLEDARAAIAAADTSSLRAWFSSARVVAGDRACGGAFLESLSQELWEGDVSADSVCASIPDMNMDAPDAAHRRLAQICRLTLGRARPLFRTAAAKTVFETASEANALDSEASARLASGAALTQTARRAYQYVGSSDTGWPTSEDEWRALAAICGFFNPDQFRAALDGAAADASNMLRRVSIGAEEEISLYGEAAQTDETDGGKLESLGFRDGHAVENLIDGWLDQSRRNTDGARLSALAPGLLTAFGQTQSPERATLNFDALLRALPSDVDLFAKLRERPNLQSTLVDFLGNFPDYAPALLEDETSAQECLSQRGEESPQTGDEWIKRFAPPWSANAETEAPQLDEIHRSVRENLSRIALFAAAGDLPFEAAARASAAVVEHAAKWCYAHARRAATPEEAKAGENFAIVALADLASGALPIASPMELCFVYEGVDATAACAFGDRLVGALETAVCGDTGITLDMRRRPGGVSSAIASSLEDFQAYYGSQAVAIEQIRLTAMRPIAGGGKLRKSLDAEILSLISHPRRAELILRDADRARARMSRHDRAQSLWDARRIDGGFDDVNLIIGALKVKHSASHPYILTPEPEASLDALARADIIEPGFAEDLKAARAFWLRLLSVQGLAGWTDPETAPPSDRLAQLVARAAGVTDLAHVEPLIRGHAERVNLLYNYLMLGRERPQGTGSAHVARAAG